MVIMVLALTTIDARNLSDILRNLHVFSICHTDIFICDLFKDHRLGRGPSFSKVSTDARSPWKFDARPSKTKLQHFGHMNTSTDMEGPSKADQGEAHQARLPRSTT